MSAISDYIKAENWRNVLAWEEREEEMMQAEYEDNGYRCVNRKNEKIEEEVA